MISDGTGDSFRFNTLNISSEVRRRSLKKAVASRFSLTFTKCTGKRVRYSQSFSCAFQDLSVEYLQVVVFQLLVPGVSKRSNILKQTCSYLGM